MKYKRYKLKEATGFFLWFLNICKFDAWTSNWGTIYIRKECIDSERLIRHEQQHALQIQRDGKFKQPFKYFIYLLKYGYRKNPNEIDARNAEDKEYDEFEPNR